MEQPFGPKIKYGKEGIEAENLVVPNQKVTHKFKYKYCGDFLASNMAFQKSVWFIRPTGRIFAPAPIVDERRIKNFSSTCREYTFRK